MYLQKFQLNLPPGIALKLIMSQWLHKTVGKAQIRLFFHLYRMCALFIFFLILMPSLWHFHRLLCTYTGLFYNVIAFSFHISLLALFPARGTLLWKVLIHSQWLLYFRAFVITIYNYNFVHTAQKFGKQFDWPLLSQYLSQSQN